MPTHTRLMPETIETGMLVTLKHGRNIGRVVALNKWRNIATTSWPNGQYVDLDTSSLYYVR
jgi:hypothetical protein